MGLGLAPIDELSKACAMRDVNTYALFIMRNGIWLALSSGFCTDNLRERTEGTTSLTQSMSSQELTRQQYSDIKGIPSAVSCLLIINPSYASYTFNPPL
jgi:hypothetical protein